MTSAERVQAVAEKGFTDRQAGFLVTVMLHSGVCVGRQYCVYARIVRRSEGATTSSPPWWQSGLPRRTPRRIGEPTSTTSTASPSMPRLESQTIATASPLRSPAP